MINLGTFIKRANGRDALCISSDSGTALEQDDWRKEWQELYRVIWATSRENLSSGFATSKDSNRPAQLMRLARVLKFRL